MKQAVLPTGQVLHFDDGVDEPTMDQLVQQHMAGSQGGGGDPAQAENEQAKTMMLAQLGARMGEIGQVLQGMAQMQMQTARMLQTLTQQVGALQQTITSASTDIVAAMTAPKTITTDENGTPTGVRVGSNE